MITFKLNKNLQELLEDKQSNKEHFSRKLYKGKTENLCTAVLRDPDYGAYINEYVYQSTNKKNV